MSDFYFNYPYMVGEHRIAELEGRCEVIPGWREGERIDLSVTLYGEGPDGEALVDPPPELASKIEAFLWLNYRPAIEEIEALAWRAKRRVNAL